jgi:hypothetical protein
MHKKCTAWHTYVKINELFVRASWAVSGPWFQDSADHQLNIGTTWLVNLYALQPPTGMAGSGKTTLIQRLASHLCSENRPPYIINMDPAVLHVPYAANIDIRDTVSRYGQVQQRTNNVGETVWMGAALFSWVVQAAS